MSDVILLLDLEPDLAAGLQRALAAAGHASQVENGTMDRHPPAVVFTGGDWRRRRELFSRFPTIVVSRWPEVAEWLEAIEAGAADYCAPPFEASHLGWVVRAARKAGALVA
jgi:hypothetical protein